MNTNKLKKYAQEARRELIKQIENRYKIISNGTSIEARENPGAIEKLNKDIKKESLAIVLERVAYTWFNRIVALRFMDANNYSKVGIVSPQGNSLQAQILVDAREGHFDEELTPLDKQERILDLLTGKIKSNNAQQEAYRILLACACNYYHSLMPFLFERITDYQELLLPEDLLSENSFISKTLQTLSDQDCSQVELIGWLYQFYISEKKDQAMAKKKAYKTDEIPAVTQLFTPHWIVQYMVENSLGRLWMENHPKSSLINDMPYYIKPESYDNKLKIQSPEDITFIDPCCGSGHILVYAFDLLTKIYEEEGYNKSEIPKLILEKNLFAIDIDKRAGELASLALTMKARAYFNRYFRKEVLIPNVIVMENCQLEEIQVSEMLDEVGADKLGHDSLNLQKTLNLLRSADTYGSLINPQLSDLNKLKDRLAMAKLDQDAYYQYHYSKIQVALKQIDFLQRKYHCVVTNPPYMGNKWLNKDLKSYLVKNYKEVKSDLFSAFIYRCVNMTEKAGKLGFMTPFVWMFISSYEQMRNKLINNTNISSLVQLEYSGFDGATVPICTFTLENTKDDTFKGSYIKLSEFKGAKNQAPKTLEAISNPDCGYYYTANQSDFKKIPGSPIAYWVSDKVRDIFANNPKLGEVGEAKVGLQTGDNNRFLRLWNEVSIDRIGFGMANRQEAQESGLKWFPYNKGGEFRKWYGNQEYLVNWEDDGREIRNFDRSVVRNPDYYFRESVSWTLLSSSSFGVRYCDIGNIFDVNSMSYFPNNDVNLTVAFLGSKLCFKILKIINPTLAFQLGNIISIPWKILYNKSIINQLDNISRKTISISKSEWDSRETSWDFLQNPILQMKNEELKEKNGNAEQIHNSELSINNYQLRKAYNLWVKQSRESFFKLHANEEELNQIFLDIYDLNDEMDKYVELEDVTLFKTEKSILTFDQAREKDIVIDKSSLEEAELRQEKVIVFDKAEAMKQFISYAVGCMFGRYTLDKEGLFIANQGQTIEQAKEEANISNLSYEIAETNVIPVLGGQWFGDDIVERFKDFLKVTFGSESFAENLAFVEESLGKDIEKYLLKDFYNDHIKRYKKRPIYWLFSSPNKGFSALIYMHRYTKDTANVVLNDYLREYVARLDKQKDHFNDLSLNPEVKAQERTKAMKELDKLSKLINELNDYERDILFPLANKHLEIDLDDGVLVNYNKFGKALRKVTGLTDKDK